MFNYQKAENDFLLLETENKMFSKNIFYLFLVIFLKLF